MNEVEAEITKKARKIYRALPSSSQPSLTPSTPQEGDDVTQASAYNLFRFTFVATVITPFHPPLPSLLPSLPLLSSPLQFLAEWGDRSQIATIALAAKNEPFGTTIGGIIGHALCTGAAVLGGKVLSEKISKKAVLFIGAG
jgi:putative Ca2+/H+ antiporter (TMEM165/GDT1 family)